MVDTVLFLGFAAAYVALLVWGALRAHRSGLLTPATLPVLVVAALVYDNAVIGAGRFIGEGTLLEALNVARWWAHALVTPLLVLFAWHVAVRAGARWARTTVAAVGAVVLTIALVVWDLLTEVRGLSVEPGWEYGVLSYASTGTDSGPPVMPLVVGLALLVAGVVVWRRQRFVWLLAGAGAMVLGSAVPLPLPSAAVTNAFELVLLVSVMATRAYQDRSAQHAGG